MCVFVYTVPLVLDQQVDCEAVLLVIPVLLVAVFVSYVLLKQMLCHKVVSLMMDVKRLALRREGLVKLQERKASPSSGGCEKIKLRSR